MRKLARDAGKQAEIEVDSAGTGNWHVGELPDPRTRAAAAKRGYDLTHRARQFTAGDFARFDLVVAMDRDNLARLRALARGEAASKLRLLRSFDLEAEAEAEVPDPYSGGSEGFEHVLDLCERACKGLLAYALRGT
ncbi:MAG: protein tyrosine phosphatase [Myxococcales bacterium]|nr:protein tyrosine phosphatase [Myxococcales bacterium]